MYDYKFDTCEMCGNMYPESWQYCPECHPKQKPPKYKDDD